MLQGGGVARGAVRAALVVEAEVVLESASPIGQRSAGYAVPELLLDGPLDTLHLTVEMGCPGSDAGVTYAQALEGPGQLTADLGAVVCLGTAGPEGLRLARPTHQGATAAEHSIDGAHAATDEAGLPQMGMQAAHSPAQLPVSATDGVQHLAWQSARATPRAARAAVEGGLALLLPGCPPT